MKRSNPSRAPHEQSAIVPLRYTSTNIKGICCQPSIFFLTAPIKVMWPAPWCPLFPLQFQKKRTRYPFLQPGDWGLDHLSVRDRQPHWPVRHLDHHHLAEDKEYIWREIFWTTSPRPGPQFSDIMSGPQVPCTITSSQPYVTDPEASSYCVTEPYTSNYCVTEPETSNYCVTGPEAQITV